MVSKTRLNVALVQMDTFLRDVDKNLAKVAEKIATRDPGVDLMVFPELTLSGYAVGDGHPHAALRLDDPRFCSLVSMTRGVSAMVGLIEETPQLRFYNSVALISDGELRAVHRKISLPNYGIFDEGKIFSRGVAHRCIEIRGFRGAPLICADAWNAGLVYLAALDDANLLIMSVASPNGGLGSRISSQSSWKQLCRFYASIYGCYVIFVNRVGREGPFSFWGESEIIDPFGNVVVSIPDDREGVVQATIDLAIVREARVIMPGLRDEDLLFLQKRLERIVSDREHK
jgi:predicted amidohydrolase